jgi:beta-xylosidase
VYWGSWTEDLCIVKSGDTFYMYAEDESNNKTVVDLLTSGDGINWTNRGHVLERPGSWLGTPLVWEESSKWYMLFEDAPAVIKLITSSDGIHWQPQNEAVASDIPGAVGPSSILKRDGTYYLFFTQSMGARWSDGIAQSTDLVHWTPYSGNPLLDGKATSAVVLETPTQYVLYGWNDDSTTAGGSQYRLYTSAKTAPEPSCAALLGAAMIGLAVYGQWKRMQRRKES